MLKYYININEFGILSWIINLFNSSLALFSGGELYKTINLKNKSKLFVLHSLIYQFLCGFHGIFENNLKYSNIRVLNNGDFESQAKKDFTMSYDFRSFEFGLEDAKNIRKWFCFMIILFLSG